MYDTRNSLVEAKMLRGKWEESNLIWCKIKEMKIIKGYKVTRTETINFKLRNSKDIESGEET